MRRPCDSNTRLGSSLEYIPSQETASRKFRRFRKVSQYFHDLASPSNKFHGPNVTWLGNRALACRWSINGSQIKRALLNYCMVKWIWHSKGREKEYAYKPSLFLFCADCCLSQIHPTPYPLVSTLRGSYLDSDLFSSLYMLSEDNPTELAVSEGSDKFVESNSSQ